MARRRAGFLCALLVACGDGSPSGGPGDGDHGVRAFDLRIVPDRVAVTQGMTTAVNVEIVWSPYARDEATIRAENLPPGVSAEPLAIAPPEQGELRLTAAGDAPEGPEVEIKVVAVSSEHRAEASMRAFVTAPHGVVDPTYGDGGVVKFSGQVLDAIALGDGGVYVLTGRYDEDARMHRLLPDGGIDVAFGGGTVIARGSPGAFAVLPNENVVVIGTDGGIVVTVLGPSGAVVAAALLDLEVGSELQAFAQPSDRTVLVIDGEAIRLDADLARDPTFGQDGVLLPAFTLCDYNPTVPIEIAVSANGAIYAGGAAGDVVAVTAYTVDGATDPAFGTDGHACLRPKPGWAMFSAGLRVDAAGRIVSAYQSGPGGTVRLEADGRLDPTWGDAGAAAISDGDLRLAAVAPDGRVYVKLEDVLVRMDMRGALDVAFADQGHLRTAGSRVTVDGQGRFLIVDSSTITRYLP